MGTQVSKGAMRSGPVVGLAIVVGQQLCLSDRGDELSVQELIAKSRIQRLTLSVLPGLPGSMKYNVTPISLAQAANA